MNSDRFTYYVSWIFHLIAFSPLQSEQKLYYKIWYYLYRGVTCVNSSIIIILSIIEVNLSIKNGIRFQIYSKTLVVLGESKFLSMYVCF